MGSIFGKSQRILYAFDFDRTLVVNNSEDTYREFLTTDLIEALLFNPTYGDDWALLSQAILNQLQKKGVKVEAIQDVVKRMEMIPGMENILKRIYKSVKAHRKKCRLIIISGSNNLFISSRLAAIDPPIIPDRIIANSVTRSSPNSNQLIFEPFHKNQTACQMCSNFLCKGAALDAYIEEEGPFDIVYYTGDGGNDVCPATRLRKQDVLFVRKGYNLDEAIQVGNYMGVFFTIQAQVIYFNDGTALEKNMRIQKPNKFICC